MGAHQKFDRVARRFISELRPNAIFPTTKQILHFEGNNGPDGVKRKSAGKDEPWHFWDPTEPSDTTLLDTIEGHFKGLVKELKENDIEKAAFEAAWMAHAIVDGFTPPHHYPYEEKMEEIRGEGMETRNSLKTKIVVQGDTKRETLQKNWQVWGAKGLIMSHAFFEFGVSSTSRPMRFQKHVPTDGELKHVKNVGLRAYLQEQALEIYNLNMYERFLRRGWTVKLSKEIRNELAPRMVSAITLAWLLAIDKAQDK